MSSASQFEQKRKRERRKSIEQTKHILTSIVIMYVNLKQLIIQSRCHATASSVTDRMISNDMNFLKLNVSNQTF